MLDWAGLVSERLGSLGGEAGQREEIVRELAGHLEDFYLEKCTRGLSRPAAMEQTLAQVADWRELTQKIRLAKREDSGMNDRTKGYWLPGLVTFTASMVWLMILQLTIRIWSPWYPHDLLNTPSGGSYQHWMSITLLRIYPLGGPYLFWLLAQPAFGALGAHLSRRGGGEERARLVAGVFPSLMFLCALSFVFVVAVFVERNPYVLAHPASFALITIPFVVVPGVALAVGVLPFLREPKAREI